MEGRTADLQSGQNPATMVVSFIARLLGKQTPEAPPARSRQALHEDVHEVPDSVMQDDPAATRVSDATRINVKLEYELLYWAKRLKVTPAELKEAVQEAGSTVGDIRKYLRRR